MKELIEQIKLKADSTPTNTDVNRRVKGAYVDCLIMAKEANKNFAQPAVIGMFMDFCQSMECDGIHNQSLGIKEGVEKYLKSINFL